MSSRHDQTPQTAIDAVDGRVLAIDGGAPAGVVVFAQDEKAAALDIHLQFHSVGSDRRDPCGFLRANGKGIHTHRNFGERRPVVAGIDSNRFQD